MAVNRRKPISTRVTKIIVSCPNRYERSIYERAHVPTMRRYSEPTANLPINVEGVKHPFMCGMFGRCERTIQRIHFARSRV